MQRIFSALFLMALLVGGPTLLLADASDFTYTIAADDTITITGYTGSEGDINIPEKIESKDVTRIGDDAFSYNNNLNGNVTLPDTITNIGATAFSGCPLTNVVFGTGLVTIEDNAFRSCMNLRSVTIPASVTTIGDNVFEYCSLLHSVTIPEGIETIGKRAFVYCSSLTNVTIPASLTDIGENAFQRCTSLAAFDVAAGNPNYSALDGVLFNKTGTVLLVYPAGKPETNYAIPGTVESIAAHAFVGNADLEQVIIPEGLTDIGENAFMGCTSLAAFDVAAGNPNYSALDGVLFNKTGTVLLVYPAGKPETNYAIPGAVENIAANAFSGNVNLEQVIMPEGLTTIGASAFDSCSVTSLTLPDSVTNLGDLAFSFCMSLTNVVLGNGLTSISQGAFQMCVFLTNVELGNSLETIGDSAFMNCFTLTSLVIPDSVKTIEGMAFMGSSLTNVIIGTGVTNIGTSAFQIQPTGPGGLYFCGNAPAGTTIFGMIDLPAGITVYRLAETTGWPAAPRTWQGLPTALWTMEETCETPVFDPAAGAYPGESVAVTVTCATPGAIIRYTLDGTEPTEESTKIASGGQINVILPSILKAKAWRTGAYPSAVQSAEYSRTSQDSFLAADFDGDGLADPALYREEDGWYVWFSGQNYALGGPYLIGAPEVTPVAADFDGDGLADPALYWEEDGWYVWFSGSGYNLGGPYLLGVPGVTPVAADFDGDGLADPALYRAQDGWYVWFSGQNYAIGGPYLIGAPEVTPVAADFDGDGLADPALYRAQDGWYVWFSGQNYAIGGPYLIGAPEVTPVAADFDGDGLVDPAVRLADGQLYIWFAGNGYALFGPYGPFLEP